MKTKDLSIKELAAYLGVSTDTIRRAARAGQLPLTRIGTAYRFDLHQVHAQMERKGRERFQRGSAGAPGGESRPRAQAISPRAGNTGALPTGIVTGGLQILWLHPSPSPLIGSPLPCRLAPSTIRCRWSEATGPSASRAFDAIPPHGSLRIQAGGSASWEVARPVLPLKCTSISPPVLSHPGHQRKSAWSCNGS